MARRLLLSFIAALGFCVSACANTITLVPAPTNSVAPAISGTAQVGNTLTSSTGTWLNNPTSYVYQWAYSGGASIGGATASTYVPVTGDIGNALVVNVTASNGSGGNLTPVASSATSAVIPASGGATFTALNTYYISPTGNDANAGTLVSPWRTPNHAVNCGDVIIAAAGSYGGTSSPFTASSWGTVSNCPSTTAGIDNAGGVYFAVVVCAGPNIQSCPISNSTGEAARISKSNWAMEGFDGTSSNQACFAAVSDTSTTIHHVAFINDIGSGCQNAAFDSYSYLTEPTSGVDQTAVVGVIAYNGARATGLCGSGVSLIPNNGPDTSAGTHVYAAGVFSYGNINGTNCAGTGTTDGEGIIFDSWGCSGYSHQGVIENSVFWGNGGPGVEAFPNAGCGSNVDVAQIYTNHVTSYGNFQDSTHKGNQGEISYQNLFGTSTASYNISNSIFQASVATTNGGALHMVACEVWATNPAAGYVTAGGNYCWQGNPGSVNVVGNFNTDVYNNNVHNTTTWPFGTNTYTTPGLASPGSLPTGAPSCAAYTNVTDCMVAAGVVSSVAPSGGAAGLGYVTPGSCASNALYPTWLKGVVYLTVSGATITENAGLVQKPCSL